MKIAIIYGHAAPADGNGLASIAFDLASKHAVRIYRDYDDIKEPHDAYIGHSFGGDKAMETIQKFPDARVEFLCLIDPVKKGWFWPWNWGLPNKHFIVPAQVQEALCFKRTNGWLPPSSKILNEGAIFKNLMTHYSHGEAPRDPIIVEAIETRLI